jgi:hypothetical protein
VLDALDHEGVWSATTDAQPTYAFTGWSPDLSVGVMGIDRIFVS